MFYRSSRPFAIYDDERMIGFALLRELENLQCHFLSQFMIDERFQGRGYGRQAMLVLIGMLKQEGKYEKIDLYYIEGDEGAKRLYEGLGFVPTGEVEAGGVGMELKIGRP